MKILLICFVLAGFCSTAPLSAQNTRQKSAVRNATPSRDTGRGGSIVVNMSAGYPRFRLGIWAGPAYTLAGIPEGASGELRAYYKDLKSGWSFGADAAWFFREQTGIGLIYSRFRSRNELDIAAEDANGNLIPGKMRDDVTVNFIGPSLNLRTISLNERIHYNMDFSLGYMSYRNDGMVMDPILITSGTAGLLWGLGADFRVGNYLAVSLGGQLILGSLKRLKIKADGDEQIIELDDKNREGISRAELKLGLRLLR